MALKDCWAHKFPCSLKHSGFKAIRICVCSINSLDICKIEDAELRLEIESGISYQVEEEDHCFGEIINTLCFYFINGHKQCFHTNSNYKSTHYYSFFNFSFNVRLHKIRNFKYNSPFILCRTLQLICFHLCIYVHIYTHITN